MNKTPFYDELFPFKYAEDDFGYSVDWKTEIEKWLVCANETDTSSYLKEKNRVKKAKQRDELLGEYRAMYVAKQHWKVGNLRFTDEDTATEKTVDFTFDDHVGKNWKVEVKSPSWLAELAEDFENGTLTREQFLERKKQPQYISGEGRWSGFDIFRNPISDALKKFKKGESNLLVLCPNTFGPLEVFGKMEDWHKMRQIVAELDTEKKISAICYLTVILNESGFNYFDHFITFSDSPTKNG